MEAAPRSGLACGRHEEYSEQPACLRAGHRIGRQARPAWWACVPARGHGRTSLKFKVLPISILESFCSFLFKLQVGFKKGDLAVTRSEFSIWPKHRNLPYTQFHEGGIKNETQLSIMIPATEGVLIFFLKEIVQLPNPKCPFFGFRRQVIQNPSFDTISNVY